jgi:integrase
MRFDARKAKLMKPGEHITLDGFPGLRLQATESKRSWTYRYKSADGRMKQVKLGEWPAVSQAAAISAWEKMRTARADGTDPALEKKGKKPAPKDASNYLVRDLCRDYYEGHVERARKPKGATIIRQLFENKLTAIADLPAASVTRVQAFAVLESVSSTPSLAMTLRSALGGAWDYALDSGRLPDQCANWWRLVMKGKLRSVGRKVDGKQRTGKRVLSDDELNTLFAWLSNFSETLQDAIVLYLWTGTRGAEIIAMEGSEITEENDGLWWTVPKHKTKNANLPDATDLRVPLVGRAEKVIRARMEKYGKRSLFPSRAGGSRNQKMIQQGIYYFQPYCKTAPEHIRERLPVTNWAPHDLRRTMRTKLAAIGCPHEVGEAIIGHVLPGVAGVYNRHHYDSERRLWLTRLSKTLEGIVAPPFE